MRQIGATGVVWRTLRGVVAMVGLAACSGASATTETPSQPTPAPDAATLQGRWTLVSLQATDGETTPVSEGSFVADFGADGDLYIQADCNVCSAAYRASDGGTIEVIGPIPCTLAYCSTAPLDTRFLALLEGASSWSIEEGALQLSSPDSGALLLQRRG